MFMKSIKLSKDKNYLDFVLFTFSQLKYMKWTNLTWFYFSLKLISNLEYHLLCGCSMFATLTLSSVPHYHCVQRYKENKHSIRDAAAKDAGIIRNTLGLSICFLDFPFIKWWFIRCIIFYFFAYSWFRLRWKSFTLVLLIFLFIPSSLM